MKSLIYLIALLLCSQMAFAQSLPLPESIRGVSEVLKPYDAVVAGYHESNDIISVFVRRIKSEGSNANIACVQFDKNAHTFSKPVDVGDALLTDLLTGIVVEDGFVVISTKRDDRVLVVVKHDGTKVLSSREIEIKDKVLWRAIRKADESGSFDANLSNAFANSRKWYHRNNNLVLIDDQPKVDGNAVIQIAKFNLTTGAISKEDLALEYGKDADHNSFLYDDKLFVMVVENNQVALNVYDINTFRKIKSNSFGPSEFAGLGKGQSAIRVNDGPNGLLEVRMGFYQQRRAIGRPWMMPLSEGGGMAFLYFPKGTALRKSAEDVNYVVEVLDNDLEPVAEVK